MPKGSSSRSPREAAMTARRCNVRLTELGALALGLALVLALAASPARSQAAAEGALTGTLKKIKDSGAIALGYRASSIPFSYLNLRRQPICYSIDLCREIVEEVSTELDGMDVKINFVPVNSANRFEKVASGERSEER